jgi:PKD repeat protein
VLFRSLLESCDASLSQSAKFNLIVNNVNQYFDNRDLGSGIANADLALTAAGCGVVCDIVADFSATPTSGTASLVVGFTDLSTGNGITSWSWDFGDGNTSTTQNPQHTYTAAGTYTVSLTAFNSDCDNTETKTAFITVSVPPIADFSSDLTSGNEPLTVTFTDLSSGTPTSWLWNFGDGGTSTAQHPSHTYTAVGTYPVALTATNGAGSDTATKVGYITVNEATTPTEMSVFDIVVTKQNLGRGDKQGEAVVTVHDDAGNPVANASVTGVFSGKTSDSRSGDTDGKGQVTFASRVARGGGEWCFEVTAVQDPLTLNYNPSSNTVTKSCESGDVF